MTETIIRIPSQELEELIAQKLIAAGLKETFAAEMAEHLTYADRRGIHSHGAVRVEYYAERIAKGGLTIDPVCRFEQTGPSCGVYHGDNTVGHVVAKRGMEEAIALAKETGIGIVGIKRMGHSGALSYYVDMAARQEMVALSFCQSDPMVVPFGGAENYFGTNPIAFAAPTNNKRPIVFDMATTVQAWGKVLDARSKNNAIPNDWAVDEQGNPTTDPYAVKGLLPIAGPKGYGLMMMVDILSGALLGLPIGKHVSSMYEDMTAKRDLGQLHVVINPGYFTDLSAFKAQLSQMIEELHQIKPRRGFEEVLYPGELSERKALENEASGIPIAKQVYDYLVSEAVHHNQYENANAFAEK